MPNASGERKDMYEDKKRIIDLLLPAVQATRAGEDVTELLLSEDQKTVMIVYEHGHRERVNVAYDSGCALIRDVMRHIN